MKVSDLKDYYKVNRPAKDIDGNRVYVEKEIEVDYNPRFKNDIIRYLATFIDITVVLIILVYFAQNDGVKSYILLFLPLILLVLNSLLESLLGTSIGKLILGIEVINDDAQHLSIFNSFKRNLLKIILFIPMLFLDEILFGSLDYFDEKMVKHGFYVIARKEKTNIIQRLNDLKN